MINKKKAEQVATRSASNAAFDKRNHTAPDPFSGWFDLAKPSRNRPPKRGWQKGARR